MGVLDDLGMTAEALREEVREVVPPRGVRRAPERAGSAAADMSWRHDLGMTEEEAIEAVASGRFRPSGADPSSALEAAQRFRAEADAALVEADRAGSSWPAAHGDALMELADDLVRSAAAGRAPRRPRGAFADFVGLS